LQFESLEGRSLLAVAAFTIELLEDAGGAPGEKIIGDSVEVGQSFFVEIKAQEFHPLYTGLQGVALNVSWDASAIELAPGTFDPQQLVTSALPLFVTGTLDASAGQILDLGGSAFPAWGTGHAIGDGTAERFALLHFRALDTAGGATISLAQGASAIATMPVSSLSSSSLSFEQQAIAILPVELAPALSPEINESIAPDDLPTEPLEAWLNELAAPDPPIAPDLPTEEVYDLIASAAPAEPTAAADLSPADDCSVETTMAEAVDLVLMGPLTLDQQPPAILRLDQLLAMIAADVTYRTAKTVRQANFVCP
jgi:hypothetical protein